VRPSSSVGMCTVVGAGVTLPANGVHKGPARGRRSPSLVARPVTAQRCALSATVEFRPTSPHQLAGAAALRFAVDHGSGLTGIPVAFDATTLSDEYADDIVDGDVRTFGFTGAFVGLWVQDLGAENGYADFTGVRYAAG
jgi:beta-xylosidase